MITVYAIRAMTYNGTAYRRGEAVLATAIDAAVLAFRGDVSLLGRFGPDPSVDPPVLNTPTKTLRAPAKGSRKAPVRRSYQRRDMKAEP